MFYGVKITSGLADWQVLQRHDGKAQATLQGEWALEPGARKVAVRSITPSIRVLNEMDQSMVLPWTACESQAADAHTGAWSVTVTLPQGGPYRIETCLDVVAPSGDHWMFHGDIRVHIGVGDLFVMAGQSNAAGYAKGVAFDPPDVRVRLLRNSSHWDMAAHPMNDATNAADCLNAPMGVTGTSPFLSFGRTYADLTGVPVGLIQTAQGGSPMKRWDDRRNGDLLRNLLEKIGTGDVRAICWYQGCADANEADAAIYEESFAHMVDVIRKHAGWCIPFFTMQLNKYTTQDDAASWAAIKGAQYSAAKNLEKVWLMPTSTLPLSDEIHNSAAGNVTLGQQLARQVHAELNGGPHYAAPAVTKAVLRDGEVVLHVDASGQLLRLNYRLDQEDFHLTDASGSIPVKAVALDGSELRLTPEKPLAGKVTLSYGCGPMEPRGPIVDMNTYLPIIAFENMEVIA